jgi:uncharacterized protein HemX
MVSVPIELIVVIINVVATAVLGIYMFRLRQRAQRIDAEEEAREQAKQQREHHDSILLGVEESNVQDGLVDIVEMHDQELERAKREREQARRERKRLQQRIDTIMASATERNGEDEPGVDDIDVGEKPPESDADGMAGLAEQWIDEAESEE